MKGFIMPKMPTVAEIAEMTKEEMTTANAKLVAKVVLTHVVLPTVAFVAVHVMSAMIIKKLSQNGQTEA